MTKQETFSVVVVATFVNAGDALAYVEWSSQEKPDFSCYVFDVSPNTSIKTIYGMEAA